MIGKLFVRTGYWFFSVDEVTRAFKKFAGIAQDELRGKSRLAYYLMIVASKVYPIQRLRAVAGARRWSVTGFGREKLDLEMHRIFDPPDIVVSSSRPATINILVPAFTIDTISAGFFGVFAFALLCSRCGYHTRLVMFENFYFDTETFRDSLKKFPIFADLLDKVELTYVGSRDKPLTVSERDIAVSTVWYSAYLAEHIRKKCSARHFLYLVQDYEAAFHPVNSNHILADSSYALPAVPWFSTQPLKEFLLSPVTTMVANGTTVASSIMHVHRSPT